MQLHYLEIVTHDIDGVIASYQATHKVSFSEPDPMLGTARTCTLKDGSTLGVRGPMRDTETPVVRPYFLVDDIEQAVKDAAAQGAEIAVPPMEIPGKGYCAIYLQGGNDHGLWQL